MQMKCNPDAELSPRLDADEIKAVQRNRLFEVVGF